MYKHLTYADRLAIERLLKKNISVAVIAEYLGKTRQTIYNELKRGRYDHLNSDWTTENRYSPDKADRRYRYNLTAKGQSLKLSNDKEFCKYVVNKIKNEHYSPEAVLRDIKRSDISFKSNIQSKTTLYRYIRQGLFYGITMQHTPYKKRKHHDHVQAKKSSSIGVSIDYRPDYVKHLLQYGHWEMDTVIGKKQTKSCLLVLTERKTLEEIIVKIPSKTAQSVVNALDTLEKKLGKVNFAEKFKTITCDNGCEFSAVEAIETSLYGGRRTYAYYCHPYSAYERGRNENNNRYIRRWFPKGTDFDKVSEAEVEKLNIWVNSYIKLFA